MSTLYTTSNGLRQDLSNAFRLIAEAKGKIVGKIGTAKASQKLHEFVCDRIVAPTANAAAIEGASFSAVTVRSFDTQNNYTQIIREDFGISGSMEASDYAGIPSQLAYQKKKAMKSILIKLEYAVINGTGNSGASGTGREMKGIVAMANANAMSSTASSATFAVASSGPGIINNCLKAMADVGEEPDFMLVSNTNKISVDSWTGSNTRYMDAHKGRLPMRISVFESSFGDIEVVSTKLIADTTVVMGVYDALKVAYLRKAFSELQAKSGDVFPVMTLLEATLELLSTKAAYALTLG
jgi:hypothetical protein